MPKSWCSPDKNRLDAQKRPGARRSPPPVSRSWICLPQPFLDDTSYIWGPAIVDWFFCVCSRAAWGALAKKIRCFENIYSLTPGAHQHLRKITFESHLQWQGLIGEIEPLKARNPRCLCEWSVFLRFPQGKLIRTGTFKSHKPRASFTFFCMRLNTTQENSESSQFPWEKCQNNRAILIKLAKTQNLAWPNAKTTLHGDPLPALCRRYRISWVCERWWKSVLNYRMIINLLRNLLPILPKINIHLYQHLSSMANVLPTEEGMLVSGISGTMYSSSKFGLLRQPN